MLPLVHIESSIIPLLLVIGWRRSPKLHFNILPVPGNVKGLYGGTIYETGAAGRNDLIDCPIAACRHDVLERISELTATGCTVVNAARSGISKSTYYRWRNALKTGGIKALCHKSTRPLSSQGKHWDMSHARCVPDIR